MKNQPVAALSKLGPSCNDYTDIKDDIPVALIASIENISEACKALRYSLSQIFDNKKREPGNTMRRYNLPF